MGWGMDIYKQGGCGGASAVTDKEPGAGAWTFINKGPGAGQGQLQPRGMDIYKERALGGGGACTEKID